ncbi:MAG: rod shape-determining protein MreC [Clostridia bacterium]|jgi:rod shape-determining protein MreC|nr:rod shape-determining protein MreC [Clostridia bacterium]
MKYIKNKIFLISLTLALCVSTVFSVFYFMGVQNIPAAMVQDAMLPFQNAFTRLSKSLDGYLVYFSNMRALYEENQALKDRVENLENQLHDAELAVGENAALRDYLGVRDRYDSFSVVQAQVLGNSDGTYLQYLTLDRGTASGIRENMAVITKNGVVGYVCEVSTNSCRVKTLLQYDTGVGVYVQRSGDVGMTDCPYAMGQKGLLRVVYLPEDASLQIGDRVVTGDLGDMYPSGLTVGHIIEVMPDVYSRTLTATLQPAVNFDDLEQVFVITGFVEKLPDTEQTTEGAQQ